MGLAIHDLGPAALELEVQGKLEKDDYERFVPLAEERINEHGRVDLLIHMSELRGWSPAALWEDLKFDARHYRDVSRLALVGDDSSKNEWMATLSRPFTAAKVEFFPLAEIDAARQWVANA